MSDAILFGGLAVLMVAWGVQSWLSDLGEARKTEAEARLIEAENAARATPRPAPNSGGEDA